jgi:hypothetical protein
VIEGPTIPQFARANGIPRRTMFRRLLALHARDRADKGDKFVPWLYRFEGGPWRVNVSRLRLAHGEMFDAPSGEELEARVDRLSERVETLDASQRGLVRRVRQLVAT